MIELSDFSDHKEEILSKPEPVHYGEWAPVSTTKQETTSVISSPVKNKWIEAMMSLHAWDLVELPKDMLAASGSSSRRLGLIASEQKIGTIER